MELQEMVKAKELEYTQYIDNHRNNVQKAWDELKNNDRVIDYIVKNADTKPSNFLSLLDAYIAAHDKSKYGKEEFDAYRKWFYPVSEEEKQSAKEEFDLAWKHHYKRNMHHWDWWHESNLPQVMPFNFVVEMICDWMAMGYQFNNTAKSWYYENKNEIHLGERQTKWVEDILEMI